jgi:hypothetical protein
LESTIFLTGIVQDCVLLPSLILRTDWMEQQTASGTQDHVSGWRLLGDLFITRHLWHSLWTYAAIFFRLCSVHLWIFLTLVVSDLKTTEKKLYFAKSFEKTQSKSSTLKIEIELLRSLKHGIFPTFHHSCSMFIL